MEYEDGENVKDPQDVFVHDFMHVEEDFITFDFRTDNDSVAC